MAVRVVYTGHTNKVPTTHNILMNTSEHFIRSSLSSARSATLQRAGTSRYAQSSSKMALTRVLRDRNDSIVTGLDQARHSTLDSVDSNYPPVRTINDSAFFFFFVVGQLHEDAPTERHPGNLTILLS